MPYPLPITLIATVGISLLQNFQGALKEKVIQDQVNSKTSEILKQLVQRGRISAENRRLLREDFGILLYYSRRIMEGGFPKWLYRSKKRTNHVICAELQSFQEYFTKHLQTKKQRVYVRLIATDTIQSEVAAEIIVHYLKQLYPHKFKNNNRISYQRIKGLQLNNPTQLSEQGFGELLHHISRIRKELEKTRIIINMTGGFKGIIPILSLIAQLVSANLLYSFEYNKSGKAGALLEMPSFNLHFLWDFLEGYEPLLDRIRTTAPSHLQAEEIKTIQQELVPLKICREEKWGYKVAPLGHMLLQWIKQRSVTSKTVIGHFIEYKFFEAFIREPWEGFPNVKHSTRPFGREIDLIFESANSQCWIFGEVKSYYGVGNSDVVDQLRTSLEKMQEKDYPPPLAFHLYLYKRPFQTLENDRHLQHLKKIKALLQFYEILTFQVFYIDLNLQLDDLNQQSENPYKTKLMSKKFTRYPENLQIEDSQIYQLIQEYKLPAI